MSFYQAPIADGNPADSSSQSGLSGTVPIYLAEIGNPHNRGLIGDLSGVGLSLGTMTANWIGFAGGYAPYGQVQWRVPLACQIPWGIILFTGLATFMPKSPRELIQKGKIEEARRELMKIRADLAPAEAEAEFALMHAQILYEMERSIPTFAGMFKTYRHRAFVYVVVRMVKGAGQLADCGAAVSLYRS
jgi:MFS family permease